MAVTLTNILQVQQAASHHKIINCPVRFTGTILWIGPKLDQLILQDDSGGMAVKMDLHNQPPMQAGEKVLIEGNCLVTREGIISGPLIDNDGIHSSAENSESVYLFAGLCPISVEWFNGPLDFELKLDCAGPEMPRQPVPGAALFRKQSDSISETNGFVQGLDYAAYEGEWGNLPDFSRLPVVKRGTVTNFTLQVRTQDTNAGLVFFWIFQCSAKRRLYVLVEIR